MIHIYYGNGKGKTTAALGLALRASGAGKKVLFVSFLKDNSSSERDALSDIVFYKNPNGLPFLCNMTEGEKQEYSLWVKSALDYAFSSFFDVVVLDEFLDVLCLLEKETVEDILFENSREYVITGHIKNDYLFDKADYITDMKKERHPFDKGIGARRGIEF